MNKRKWSLSRRVNNNEHSQGGERGADKNNNFQGGNGKVKSLWGGRVTGKKANDKVGVDLNSLLQDDHHSSGSSTTTTTTYYYRVHR